MLRENIAEIIRRRTSKQNNTSFHMNPYLSESEQQEQQQQQQSQQQQHVVTHHNHVYLFRHCIRSTRKFVNYYGSDGRVTPKTHLSDYGIQSPIPNWEELEKRQQQQEQSRFKNITVPLSSQPIFAQPVVAAAGQKGKANKEVKKEYLCTSVGKQIIQGTGKHVLNEIVNRLLLAKEEADDSESVGERKVQGEEPSKPQKITNRRKKNIVNIQFQFIVDSPKRDVETATSLIKGINEQVQELNSSLKFVKSNSNGNDDGAVTEVIVKFDNVDIRGVHDKGAKEEEGGATGEAATGASASSTIEVQTHRLLFKQKICSDPFKDKTSGQKLLEKLKDDINFRLNYVPPPVPNLQQTYQRMIELDKYAMSSTTKSTATMPSSERSIPSPPLSVLPNDAFNVTTFADAKTRELTGMQRVIGWIAQITYFTRSSNILIDNVGRRGSGRNGRDGSDGPQRPVGAGARPFLSENVTIEDIYHWLAWLDWTKSVVSQDNIKSSLRGTVFGYAILQALEYGYVPNASIFQKQANADKAKTEKSSICLDDNNYRQGRQDDEIEYYHYNAKVTMIVGHDSDIDDVESVFGLRHKLDEPYYQHKSNNSGDNSGKTTSSTSGNANNPLLPYEYKPSPPGSAMHFMYDSSNTNNVEMSYVYPVHLTKLEEKDRDDVANDPHRIIIPNNILLNTSGILEETPFIMFPRTIRDFVKEGDGSVIGTNITVENLITTINNNVELSKDGKRSIVKSSEGSTVATTSAQRRTGLDILHDRLLTTVNEIYPDAKECYSSVKSSLTVNEENLRAAQSEVNCETVKQE